MEEGDECIDKQVTSKINDPQDRSCVENMYRGAEGQSGRGGRSEVRTRTRGEGITIKEHDASNKHPSDASTRFLPFSYPVPCVL